MPYKNPEDKTKYQEKYYNKVVKPRNIVSPARVKMHQRRRKLRALNRVGKGKIECVRCGCIDYRLLEINHKNGGGSKEKKLAGIYSMHNLVLNTDRGTEDLEILCRPCNAIHYLESKYGKIGLKVVWSNMSYA